MRVAVIVPCYNDGATLPATLASLSGEESHELVVVDDGSSDPATIALMRNLERDGIHVVRQQNRGLGGARMTGVAATRAPYVLPLDSDDLIAPGSVAALADALDHDPQAMASWGDVELFGDFRGHFAGAAAIDPWLLTYVNEIPVASLIRREALLEAGGWQLRGYEDWDLWMTFAERSWHGIHVPRTVLLHRQHGHRLVSEMLDEFGAVYRRLGERHPALFYHRRDAWLRSRAPWRAKLLFPLIAALPGVSVYDKHRLFRLVSRPRETLPGRGARLRAARTS